MSISEEKARTVRCPHAPRGPDGLMGACMGSHCMMWRWTYDYTSIPAPLSNNFSREEFRERIAARTKEGFEIYADTENGLRLRRRLNTGFCGLAGMPVRDAFA